MRHLRLPGVRGKRVVRDLAVLLARTGIFPRVHEQSLFRLTLFTVGILCCGCDDSDERSTWISYCVGHDCSCEEDADCVVAECVFEPSVGACGCCYFCRNGDPIRKDAWEALRAEWQALCGLDLCIDTESDYDCYEWSLFEPACLGGRCAAVLESTWEH